MFQIVVDRGRKGALGASFVRARAHAHAPRPDWAGLGWASFIFFPSTRMYNTAQRRVSESTRVNTRSIVGLVRKTRGCVTFLARVKVRVHGVDPLLECAISALSLAPSPLCLCGV